MATNTHLVFLNFIWRLEQISPSQTQILKNYAYMDESDPDWTKADGYVRQFTAYWDRSAQIIEPSDMYDRVHEHEFVIEFTYPKKKITPKILHQILLEDRKDTVSQLRDPAKWKGYSNVNTTNNIGLYNRVFRSDQLAREELVWIYRQVWRCTIQEIE